MYWQIGKVIFKEEQEGRERAGYGEKNNWTVRQLERQVNSQLFERLLVSNNIETVLAVAREEKLPADAKEIIKDPMILEFLGLKRESAYYEKDLKSAIITHLQEFLLEI